MDISEIILNQSINQSKSLIKVVSGPN